MDSLTRSHSLIDDKLDECKVVSRELVVASCHAPSMLDLVEKPFGQISGAQSVAQGAAFPWLMAEVFARLNNSES